MHRRTLTTEAKQTHGRTSLGLVRPAEGRGTNAEGRGTNSLRIFSGVFCVKSAYLCGSPERSEVRPQYPRSKKQEGSAFSLVPFSKHY